MKFSYLIWFSALILAGCAAFISVFGLGHLFSGAGTAVLIMVSGLEFAKLIAATALHRYWDRLSLLLKTYLTIGVIVLIALTSTGIYGFLSNGYQKTANKLGVYNNEVAILDSKKKIFEKEIYDNDATVISKTKRMTQLSDLREKQEIRLDTLIANNHWSNVKKTREDIDKATDEITKLNTEIDVVLRENNTLSDSVNRYQRLIVESAASGEINNEIGPLKYISTISGISMDRVANYLIIIIMLVFDPMAVSLLLTANKVWAIEKEDEPNVKKPTPSHPPLVPIAPLVNVVPEVVDANEEAIEEIESISEESQPESEIETPKVVEPSVVTTEDKGATPKKRLPVIPTGEITKDDLNIIRSNRGFSVDIPEPTVETDDDRIWLKKKRNVSKR